MNVIARLPFTQLTLAQYHLQHARCVPPPRISVLLQFERGEPVRTGTYPRVGRRREAKFWLRPAVRVAMSEGLDARTLRELTGVVEQNLELIERTWHEYFR